MSGKNAGRSVGSMRCPQDDTVYRRVHHNRNACCKAVVVVIPMAFTRFYYVFPYKWRALARGGDIDSKCACGNTRIDTIHTYYTQYNVYKATHVWALLDFTRFQPRWLELMIRAWPVCDMCLPWARSFVRSSFLTCSGKVAAQIYHSLSLCLRAFSAFSFWLDLMGWLAGCVVLLFLIAHIRVFAVSRWLLATLCPRDILPRKGHAGRQQYPNRTNISPKESLSVSIETLHQIHETLYVLPQLSKVESFTHIQDIHTHTHQLTPDVLVLGVRVHVFVCIARCVDVDRTRKSFVCVFFVDGILNGQTFVKWTLHRTQPGCNMLKYIHKYTQSIKCASNCV